MFDQFADHERLAAIHYRALPIYIARQRRYLQRIVDVVTTADAPTTDNMFDVDERNEENDAVWSHSETEESGNFEEEILDPTLVARGRNALNGYLAEIESKDS